jgi:hypothetical protein
VSLMAGGVPTELAAEEDKDGVDMIPEMAI